MPALFCWNKMSNLKTLIPFNKRSKEEVYQIRRKGAYAKAEAQKKRKELKETLIMLLELGNTQEDICKKLIKGKLNPKTFEVIRDTIGEKPKDVVDNNVNVNVALVEFVENGKGQSSNTEDIQSASNRKEEE